MRLALSSLLLSLSLCACGEEALVMDPGLEGLSLESVQPAVAVPGSTLVITGRSFITEEWGGANLVIGGTRLPLQFVDFHRYEVQLTPELMAGLGEGSIRDNAHIEIDSYADGTTHRSNQISVELDVRAQLQPELAALSVGSFVYVNDAIELEASGLLLNEGEGQTLALISGCFQPEGGSTCDPIMDVEVPVSPASEFDRSSGTFPFSPAVAGIQPGEFVGKISLRNVHDGGSASTSPASLDLETELTLAALFSISSDAASLGQYLDVIGGGFVGGEDDGTTEVEFVGTFTPDRSGEPIDMNFSIIPIYDQGRRLRYVLNEDDMLGQTVDLRRITGVFEGQVTPIVYYKSDRVTGQGTSFQFRIAPVKQVVYLKFLPSFVATLRFFGLRAMREQIVQRIVQVTERDFATINMDFRLEEPTDFELYETVEMAGWNPNCREVERCATLGLDNTAGKDVGNLRLHDYLGVADNGEGLGYGGVFIQALFGFSNHPHDLSAKVPAVASSLFDEIFDPFRPDEGGRPVTSADFGSGPLAIPTTDPGCPASDRSGQVQCAVWALGNLVGTTVSHEVGHSLGLASPYGSATQYHLPSDEPDRLMDNGGDRPFEERAQLLGEGPGVFCSSHYEYLREILPTDDAEDTTPRPTCF